MVILIAYELWLERSRIIFEGKVRPVRDIVGVDMVVFAPVPQKTRPLLMVQAGASARCSLCCLLCGFLCAFGACVL
jgi:hypothetical protein